MNCAESNVGGNELSSKPCRNSWSGARTTEEIGYNITEDPVSVHDLQATMLHLMGIDHTRLTYRFQGRDFRLTDVHGEVVKAVLA